MLISCLLPPSLRAHSETSLRIIPYGSHISHLLVVEVIEIIAAKPLWAEGPVDGVSHDDLLMLASST